MFVGNKLPQYEQHFETRVVVRNKLCVLSSDQSPPFYDLLQFNNFRFLISVFGEWNFGRSYQVLVKSPKTWIRIKQHTRGSAALEYLAGLR